MVAIIPVMLVITFLIWGLLQIIPANAAVLIAGDQGTMEDIERIEKQLGLDKPVYVQYGIWLGKVLQGDMGVSPHSKHTVTSMIIERLEPTLSIGVYALIVKLLVAVPLGILAAWKANTWMDRSSMIFAVMAFSIPVFWLEYNMIYLFAVNLGWFPAIGYVHIGDSIGGWIHSITMPSVATGLIAAAGPTRIIRSTMLGILKEDYIRTAKAKGLSERVVLWQHALINGGPPFMTMFVSSVAGMIGGLVISEQVFAIPGTGRLLVNAISTRDYPMIQGILMFVSLSVVFFNLVMDIAYVYIDPRIKY